MKMEDLKIMEYLKDKEVSVHVFKVFSVHLKFICTSVFMQQDENTNM